MVTRVVECSPAITNERASCFPFDEGRLSTASLIRNVGRRVYLVDLQRNRDRRNDTLHETRLYHCVVIYRVSAVVVEYDLLYLIERPTNSLHLVGSQFARNERRERLAMVVSPEA